jgi:hypothetical protein
VRMPVEKVCLGCRETRCATYSLFRLCDVMRGARAGTQGPLLLSRKKWTNHQNWESAKHGHHLYVYSNGVLSQGRRG